MTVLYSSKYGSSKIYADLLAKALDTVAYPVEQHRRCAENEDLVFVSGVYNGKVRKLAILKHRFSRLRAVVAVGLFSEDRHYVCAVKDDNMHYQFERVNFFYVPGAMYSSRLRPYDRMLSRRLARLISRKPAEKRAKWERAFSEIAGSDVSYVSEAHLVPVLDYLRS